ncbi:hypothetical protein TNCV_3374151 [Trichonephila clavipes]|nr:hypothetical protein TNCV_3374151 [Trichonephila clavipes]
MIISLRPHRARIVEEYLRITVWNEWNGQPGSPDLNPIEHLWDYLGREVAALNPPPRINFESKTGIIGSRPHNAFDNRQPTRSTPELESYFLKLPNQISVKDL